ncbi:hypothetical protein MKX03_033518, partial [Papaver bracteatum]
MAWASYGHDWRTLRRISTLEIFSSKRLHMLSDIRADEVKSMIRRLTKPSEGEAYGT